MVSSSDATFGPPFPSARKCVLVVEDEFLIRMMVSEELREAGYAVIEAINADEALIVLNSPVRIDLVFSDVRMPGSLDGLGLLAIVRETFPALPVIITSAHLDPDFAIANGSTRFLAKPFPLEVAVSAVRDELAGADER